MARIIFMGTPDFAVPCVQAIINHPECELVAVVCQPDKLRGRHKTPQPPPVKVAALDAGAEVLQPRRIKKGAFPARLAELELDLAVVTAYGRILPQHILDTPRLGCVNVHASLLPRWRGAAPLQWSIAEGDATSGVCLMQMDAGLDTGDELARVEFPLGHDETGQTLHDRLSTAGATLLSENLSAILAGTLTGRPQPDTGMTYARMLSRDDGRIDWTQPATTIERRLRAFYPWPGGFTTLDGKTFKIFPPSRAVDVAHDAQPGSLLPHNSDELLIACGEGALAASEIQRQGKRRMAVSDFLRGVTLPESTTFGVDHPA
jgi:methionyl-tRNA formyltransferase